jgi:uncharacterized membrane protein HdeD (DUF308 family)
MSLLTPTERTAPRYEECMRLHHCWLWFLVLGILLMLIGAFALTAAFITGLATVMLFGILLMVGAVVQIVESFLARSWRGFFLHLLAGVLEFIIGALLVDNPGRGADIICLILAVGFLVGGAVRIIYAGIEQFAGWPWVLLNGAITLLLGILIWKGWPEYSEVIIGTFVGIDLLFNGWTWVMLGMLVKTAAPGAPQPVGR